MRKKDLLLITVALGGLVLGVLLPGPSGIFTPFTLHMMMTVLFMSFLGVDFSALARVSRKDFFAVACWSTVKLLVMPLGLWAVFHFLSPAWALPVLLLAGMPTGVTSPFFAQLLGADPSRALQLVMLTSVAVPVVLPALVGLMASSGLDIPLSHMARMLAMVVFIPLAAAWAVRRFAPRLIKSIARVQYPLSLTLFFLINLGVFAPYSGFILENRDQVVWAIVVAYAVGGASLGLALLGGRFFPGRLDPLGGGIALGMVNNVLGLVFTGRFFSAEAPLLAAAYMFPLFSLLIPLRMLATRRAGAGGGDAAREAAS